MQIFSCMYCETAITFSLLILCQFFFLVKIYVLDHPSNELLLVTLKLQQQCFLVTIFLYLKIKKELVVLQNNEKAFLFPRNKPSYLSASNTLSSTNRTFHCISVVFHLFIVIMWNVCYTRSPLFLEMQTLLWYSSVSTQVA